MLVPWRKTTSPLAFLLFLIAPAALAGPGAFGVAAFPVCQPRGVHLSWSASSGTAYTVVATDSRGFTFTSNSATPAAPNSSFCLNGDLHVAEAAYCAVSGPAVHLAWTPGNGIGGVSEQRSDHDHLRASARKTARNSALNLAATH